MYTLLNNHFNATYEHIWIVVIAFFLLGLYLMFLQMYSKSIEIQKKISEDDANKVLKNLVLLSMLLLAGFIIYHIFFFRPDAIQMQADNISLMMGNGQLPEVVKML